ncbi:hypothetical protein ABIA39_003038 [Nocardia sp. GAS34]
MPEHEMTAERDRLKAELAAARAVTRIKPTPQQYS